MFSERPREILGLPQTQGIYSIESLPIASLIAVDGIEPRTPRLRGSDSVTEPLRHDFIYIIIHMYSFWGASPPGLAPLMKARGSPSCPSPSSYHL